MPHADRGLRAGRRRTGTGRTRPPVPWFAVEVVPVGTPEEAERALRDAFRVLVPPFLEWVADRSQQDCHPADRHCSPEVPSP